VCILLYVNKNAFTCALLRALNNVLKDASGNTELSNIHAFSVIYIKKISLKYAYLAVNSYLSQSYFSALRFSVFQADWERRKTKIYKYFMFKLV